MRNNFLKSVLTCLAILTFSACENQIHETPTAPSATPSKEMIYVYQNQKYKVRYVEEGENTKLLEGANNKFVEEALEKAPAYLIDPNQENVLYLFDNEKEREQFVKDKYQPKGDKTTARTAKTNAINLSFYEHDNFSGFHLTPGKYDSKDVREFNGTYYCSGSRCPDEVNDRFSSVIFTGQSLTLYTEFNYSGRSWTIVGDSNNPKQVAKFRDLKYGLFNKYNFNDKVSSFYLTE